MGNPITYECHDCRRPAEGTLWEDPGRCKCCGAKNWDKPRPPVQRAPIIQRPLLLAGSGR